MNVKNEFCASKLVKYEVFSLVSSPNEKKKFFYNQNRFFEKKAKKQIFTRGVSGGNFLVITGTPMNTFP